VNIELATLPDSGHIVTLELKDIMNKNPELVLTLYKDGEKTNVKKQKATVVN